MKTSTAESLPGAPGLRNDLGAMSRHRGSPVPAEGLDPSKIFTRSQFSTWVSCSGFISFRGLMHKPNVGRFAQAKCGRICTRTSNRSAPHTKVTCSTEVYILAPKYKNTKAHRRKYLRFSFKVQKPTYFYASLVLSLAESLELKYSKNTQAEENNWPAKFQFKC